ncbi:glycosyltransferase family 8 protein [Sphaerulina musiva SO2202]|uniref:Glycosyltransferase family 8 protein n=1 Tax=Sphaerulina musiva (strain SO2202) TaxID=692275 RepID=M3CQH2_SPHMS|nr:glycosyltransferase family 8 protein [Sphaerulina musiva SO2202]EMF15923.1 glycosyltransferase family 8 protein [Sphaerulina musiva SO2202]
MAPLVRNICFLIGAVVILAVLYSSTSISGATTRWTNPALGGASAANPPSAVLGVPDDSIVKSDGDNKVDETVQPAPERKEGDKKDEEKEEKKEKGGMEKALEDSKATKTEFNEVKYAFQYDLDQYAMPTYNARDLRRYMPVNWQGPGRHAFCTYYSTRNATLHDPYFLAALSLTYRLLWDPASKSDKYPLVVFVAPFTPDEHRHMLEAAGAIVRELDLIEYHPDKATFSRWRDLFSKINMWRQTDFELLAFLDLDAFPVQNIDGIFHIADRQRCKPELLPKEDKLHEKEICDYVFSGTSVGGGYKEINVGVVVFNPNEAMRNRLLRESLHTDKWDNFMAEQAFLSYAFSGDGPFPASEVDREWNGFFPQDDEGPKTGKLKIIHEKLWAENDHLTWAKNWFSNEWKAMLKMFNSKKFVQARESAGRRPF